MSWLRRRGGENGAGATRVFFATDIHGSDLCFKKFLNAGRFFGATHLIMGGDITGKSLVTIRAAGGSWSGHFREHDYVCRTEGELAELVQAIRDAGQYPFVGDDDEIAALADDAHRAEVFDRVVVEGMQRWMDLAEERLAGTGIQCYVTPGNDDFFSIDAVIRDAPAVHFVEGACVSLDGVHEMITTGYSNPTPWNTERELSEEDMGARLEAMWTSVQDPANAVAVIHAPPAQTALDEAPQLGDDLSLQGGPGGLRMTHVGSAAVRAWLERAQPLCGLHGHVHESKATERIGRTLCVNPGSEYSEGVLAGSIIVLGDGQVVSHQFVSG
jgi:Icc-related predicted phosphoesterase